MQTLPLLVAAAVACSPPRLSKRLPPAASANVPDELTDTAADTNDETGDSGSVETGEPADTQTQDTDETGNAESGSPDTGPPALCPPDMVPVGDACVDRFEAPNTAGGLPLVMYSFDEADAWCVARGKRLCFDDEWEAACEGESAFAYPYGNTHEPGRCNDEETWRVYSQQDLNGWPSSASTPDITTLTGLLKAVRGLGAEAAAAEIEELYQGEGGGDNAGCGGDFGAFDLVGNVEEWTRRRDGGEPSFHGNLKGRYWAEPRTCQSDLTSHGDGFRFYEIGFRCCSEQRR